MKQFLCLFSLFIVMASCKKNDAPTKSGDNNPKDVTYRYERPEPVNGILKGVVELGATGFNSFVINVDEQKRWKLVKAEYGFSKVFEENTSSDGIRRGLVNYIKTMIDTFHVAPSNIHFVVSSGANKSKVVQEAHHVLRDMGFIINYMYASDEGKYALLASIPETYYHNAFVVDIGSSNTKIAYTTAGFDDAKGLETYGSKYFKEEVTDEKAYDDAVYEAKKVAKKNTEKCFIIGGIPFDLANSHRVGEENYTVLKKPEQYASLVKEKDGDKKLISGLNLYKAIRDATGCNEFIFIWDTNFSIGFLLNLKK